VSSLGIFPLQFIAIKTYTMKIFIYTLIVLAAGLIIFNTTKLDFGNLLEGESTVAVISILAGLCAVLLLTILLVSKKIASRAKK
jgi:predicted membrane channel-forming protein YqfA (hemolysin III family)